MPVEQDLGNFGVGRGGCARTRGLDVDLLHIATPPAQEVVPRGRDRDDHDVILVVEAAGGALLRKDADDPEALAVDLHRLADGIIGAEQVRDGRLPNHRHAARAVDVGRGEELAARQLIVSDRGKVLRGPS